MVEPIDSAGLRGSAKEAMSAGKRLRAALARQPDVQPKTSHADKRRGCVRHPAPDGHLYCTLGNHTAPISEFPTKKVYGRVRVGSWCDACKRTYDRDAQRKARGKS